MGEGVRLFTFADVRKQALRNGAGRAIPAGCDADAALPEAGSLQVAAGWADKLPGGILEHHLDAARGAHAHCTPAIVGNVHTGLIEAHRNQLLVMRLVPHGYQCMAQGIRT